MSNRPNRPHAILERVPAGTTHRRRLLLAYRAKLEGALSDFAHASCLQRRRFYRVTVRCALSMIQWLGPDPCGRTIGVGSRARARSGCGRAMPNPAATCTAHRGTAPRFEPTAAAV